MTIETTILIIILYNLPPTQKNNNKGGKVKYNVLPILTLNEIPPLGFKINIQTFKKISFRSWIGGGRWLGLFTSLMLIHKTPRFVN